MCTTRFCGFGTPGYPSPSQDTQPPDNLPPPQIPYHPDTLPLQYPTPDILSPRKDMGPEIPYLQKEHGTRDTLPPANRLTDAYENITFPQLLSLAVKTKTSTILNKKSIHQTI